MTTTNEYIPSVTEQVAEPAVESADVNAIAVEPATVMGQPATVMGQPATVMGQPVMVTVEPAIVESAVTDDQGPVMVEPAVTDNQEPVILKFQRPRKRGFLSMAFADIWKRIADHRARNAAAVGRQVVIANDADEPVILSLEEFRAARGAIPDATTTSVVTALLPPSVPATTQSQPPIPATTQSQPAAPATITVPDASDPIATAEYIRNAQMLQVTLDAEAARLRKQVAATQLAAVQAELATIYLKQRRAAQLTAVIEPESTK